MIKKIKSLVNTEEKKRLLGNFFSLFLLRGINYIVPLITFPYLVKVLGIEKYGLLAFTGSFIMYFTILTEFGFNLSATREISIYRDDKEKLNEIFSSVIIIKIILIIFAFILLQIFIIFFNKLYIYKNILILFFFSVIGQAFFPVWFFQGIEKMKYITYINLFSKLMYLLLMILFIKKSDEYYFVPLFNGVLSILESTIAIFIIFKIFKINFHLQQFSKIKKYFFDSFDFFLSRVSVSIYTNTNLFILGLFYNTTIVGYYKIADSIYKLLQSIYQPIIQTIYPYMTKYKNIDFFKKLFKIIFIFNITLTCIVFFSLNDIFMFLLHKHFNENVIDITKILLIAECIVVPSMLIGYPLLGAFGLVKYANKSVIYASFLHLFGIILLILFNKLTIYSIAFMVIITQFFDLMYRIFALKLIKFKNEDK